MKTRALHPLFVGEILDVDTSSDLSQETVREIARAIDQFAVVVFRDQQLSVEGQVKFARYFGPLEVATMRTRSDNTHRTSHDEVVDIANVDENDRIQAANDRRRLYNIGNRLWHTDSSFREVRGALSMLYARRIPGNGGDTEFADMRAAYDALPPDVKRQADGLWIEHDRTHSRVLLGVTDHTPDEIAAFPPVRHKLVQVHPTSGRTTLYLGAHAKDVVDWPVPEGRIFLRELTEAATQREFVYRHKWRVGDLVIWDNRCTMHRACTFDGSQVRELTRVTTADVR